MKELIISVNGFASAHSLDDVYSIIKQQAGINIAPVENDMAAYIQGCWTYAMRHWKQAPWNLPTLPRFDDWQSNNCQFFQEPALIYPAAMRIFAARSCECNMVAILTSVELVVDFLKIYPDSQIIETAGVQEAQNKLHETWLMYILPFTQYLEKGIPPFTVIPCDTPVQLDYAAMVKLALEQIPKDLPFGNLNWYLNNMPSSVTGVGRLPSIGLGNAPFTIN